MDFLVSCRDVGRALGLRLLSIYSPRRTRIGSTLVARRAGIYVASSAAPVVQGVALAALAAARGFGPRLQRAWGESSL